MIETFLISLLETQTSNDIPHMEKLWTSEAINALINLVKKYDKDLDRGVKKYIWKKIAQELSEVFHKIYTETQISTKWKGLVKTYKDITTHNKTSGKNRKHWEYYNMIHEILFCKPEISPVATCSSSSGLKVRSLNGSLESSTSTNLSPHCAPNSTATSEEDGQSNSSYESTFAKKRRERASGVDRRHKEKMQKIDRLQNSLDELINVLKTKDKV